jgi:hypothetical protein
MQLSDHSTAGPAEEEGKQRVHHASNASCDHAQAEAEGDPEMLPVRLADGPRMLSE